MEQLVRQLIEKNISFAFYRLPSETTPYFAVEGESGVELLDSLDRLNGRSGIVIAPFRPDSSHPILLIPADRYHSEWKDIENAARKALESDSPAKTAHPAEQTGNGREMPEAELKANYTQVFQRFMEGLENGELSKLVLSRKATYPIPGNVSPWQMYITACESYPRMMISFTYTPYTGIWIGCSPEIILKGKAQTWNTVALAGTTPAKKGEPVQWSEKNRKEQAYVSAYIRNVLENYGNDIREEGPHTVYAGEIAHLKTDFSFQVHRTSAIGDLLKALHPTPAVCGVPKETAYRFINENEGYDRAYYSGITGWLQPEKETFLYVNLRCARISGQTISFYAGGGILDTSEAESEWKETTYKMNTLKKCIDHVH